MVGFIGYATMGSVNDGETYFVWYGYIALIPLATVTLMALWRERHLTLGRLSRRIRAVTTGSSCSGAWLRRALRLAVPDTWKTVKDRQTVPRDAERTPGLRRRSIEG